MKMISSIILIYAFSHYTGSSVLAYSGEWFRVCKMTDIKKHNLAMLKCSSIKCSVIQWITQGTQLVQIEPHHKRGAYRKVQVFKLSSNGTYTFAKIGWVDSTFLCDCKKPFCVE